MSKIAGIIMMIAPWIAVNIVFAILAKKQDRYLKSLHFEKEHYCVSNAGISGIIAGIGILDIVVSVVVSIGLWLQGVREAGAYIFIFLFQLIGLWLMSYAIVWKIDVDNGNIKYRSFLGITRNYKMDSITEMVYTKRGSFRLYIGKKRILSCDASLSGADLLQNEIKARNIPCHYIDNATVECHVISAKKAEKILLIAVEAVIVLFVILIRVNHNTTAMWILETAALLFLIVVMYRLADRVVVENNDIYRKRLLHKTCHFTFTEITECREKDDLGDGRIVVYAGKRKLFHINMNYENIDFFQKRIMQEKILYRKME